MNIIVFMLFFAAFLLYTLQVAMAFAFISSLYGDFMQVRFALGLFSGSLYNHVLVCQKL